jgi:hypothetical protein
MAVPAGEKLDHARPFEGLRFGEESLLGVKVGRAGAGIQLGQLGVADGRGEAQDQREHDSDPHGATGHGRAVEGLLLIGQPQKRARRDERHGVDRQPRSASARAK